MNQFAVHQTHTHCKLTVLQLKTKRATQGGG